MAYIVGNLTLLTHVWSGQYNMGLARLSKSSATVPEPPDQPVESRPSAHPLISHVEADVEDVAILDDVVASLQP